MQPNPYRILVTEDHDDTRELFVLVLQECHYEVVTSTSVFGTLDLANKQNFDLFLLDSRLSDGSGVDLCRSIRQFDKATPILFCSGLAYEKDRQEALEAGAQSYLIKPVEFSTLCQKVAELIAGSPKSQGLIAKRRTAGTDSGDLPLVSVGA
ncbi:MAG TPA: response regulator [Pyrinomonadaceae bacterium]|nr:response regulator [Pyrinomonadaceae bacterium]